MRIVLDTNVWISGLLWRGPAWRLLLLAESSQVECCLSALILSELAEVLSYPRFAPRLEQLRLSPEEIVAYVLSLATVFDVPEHSGQPIVAADPDDDIFIDCAVTAQASYILSGDQHLLALSQHGGVSIVTIRDFLTKEFPGPDKATE